MRSALFIVRACVCACTFVHVCACACVRATVCGAVSAMRARAALSGAGGEHVHGARAHTLALARSCQVAVAFRADVGVTEEAFPLVKVRAPPPPLPPLPHACCGMRCWATGYRDGGRLLVRRSCSRAGRGRRGGSSRGGCGRTGDRPSR
jgi:hypothetical protein